MNSKYKTLLTKYGIDTPLRTAHFMAQLEHESGLKPVAENLNYSQQGLLNIFGKYFTPDTKDDEGKIIRGTAYSYARKPAMIANRVYANRMGNGDEASGDGFKYRGRGFIQITGKDNYRMLAKDTGIDYLNNPDLLLKEADAMISALWYWKRINGNKLADADNTLGLTKAINGGTNGLAHRQSLVNKWKNKL